MSSQTVSDQRRARRKRANFTAVVTNTIRDEAMGFLGNLSTSGMLLICAQPPGKDAIYQLQVPLHGLGPQPEHVEIGVQAQWHTQAATPGQVWAGFRIIAVSTHDAGVIDRWLALPT